MTAGLVYYSDGHAAVDILETVRAQLLQAKSDRPLVAVTLAPVDFGDVRIVLPLERGRLTMFRQILAGLEALDTDVAFLVEHDVLYPAEHFVFSPPAGAYYYNQNVWRVDAETGRALFYRAYRTAALCADRALLVEHYRKRVARTAARGYFYKTGYEPGFSKPPIGIDAIEMVSWMSSRPLVDIRHGDTLTSSRWRRSAFRDQTTCEGWRLADSVPSWGHTQGRFTEWLTGVGAAA
jgi:hypothetical protein